MAKQASRQIANSKIRFILLEADLSDGDLSQITQAISSALARTGTAQPKSIAAINGQTIKPARSEVSSDISDEEPDVDEHSALEPETSANQPRQARVRKFPVPKVLSNVDLNSGDTPFSSFSSQKNSTTDRKRYLVIAYWFKTYRKVDAVTADHIYTGYKKAGWGTKIKDFSKTLYALARDGKGDMKDGLFTINHIGEDAVENTGK